MNQSMLELFASISVLRSFSLFFPCQTPRAWVDERRRGSHKRSASCGSTDQLKEVRHLELIQCSSSFTFFLCTMLFIISVLTSFRSQNCDNSSSGANAAAAIVGTKTANPPLMATMPSSNHRCAFIASQQPPFVLVVELRGALVHP